MYGNLKVFSGETAFNDYAHHLRELGEPILPRSGLLWILRVVLLGSILAHMGAALTLWRRAQKGRGGIQRYRSTRARTGVQRTYASFTLRWGGIVIALFVLYHLMHLTWNIVAPGGAAPRAVRPGGQRLPVLVGVVVVYTVAMIAVGFRLRHGIWSALTTLGANVSSLCPAAPSTCWRTSWPASSPSGSSFRRTRSCSGW